MHSHQRHGSGQASQGEQDENKSQSIINEGYDKLKKQTRIKDIASSVHADHSVLSHKVSFRLNQVDLDRKATHDINNLINKLHRENTKQLVKEERVQEMAIKESIESSLYKIDYLISNYQEEWLKLMYP